MLKTFYSGKTRQLFSVFFPTVLAAGVVMSAPEREFFIGREPLVQGKFELPFQPYEQQHSGQDRGDESDTIIVTAPSVYTNVAAAVHMGRTGSWVTFPGI
jgi:hypothetical protein